MEQSSENALDNVPEEDETADSQSSLKTSCSQSTNFSNNSDVPNPKQEDRVSSTELPFRGSKWALARTAWSRRLWTGGTRRKSSAQWMMEDFKALQRRIQQSKGAVHPEAGSSSPATPTASGPDHGPGETAAAEACITPCLAGGDEEREGPPPPPPPVTPQQVAEQQRPLTELSGKGGEEVSRQVQQQSRRGFVVDVLPTVSEASPPTENQPSVADDVPTPGPPPLPTAHRPQRRHQRRSDNDGRAQFPTPLFVRDHPPYYNNNNNVCARDRGDQDFAGPYGHVQHGGLLARGWECWELGPDSRTPTPDVGAGFQQFLHHPESLPSYMDFCGYHHGTGSDSDCDADYRRGYFRQEGGYLIPPRSPTDSLPTTAPTSTLVQPFWGRRGGGAQQGMMEAMGLPFPSASPTDQSDSDTCGLKVGRGFGWSLDGGGSDTPLSEDDKPGGRPPHTLRRPHDSRGLQDAWLLQHHMVDRSLDSDQTTSLFSSSSPSSPSPSSSSTLTPSTSSEVRGFSNDRDAPGFRREERVKGNNQPRLFGVSGGGKGGKPVLRDPFAKAGHATTEDDEADLTFQWFRPVGLSSDSEPWREGSEGRRQRAAVPTTESSSSYTSILFTTDEEDAHGPYRRH